MTTISSSSTTRSVTSEPRSSVCSSITSRNCASTVMTGLREFMLLWNTVDICRQRIGRSSLLEACVMSVPSKRIVPPLIVPGASVSRRIAVPRVDLPLPDSPSSPTNSPSSRLKLTPRTACTVAAFLGA